MIFSVLEEVDMVAVHSSTVGMDAIVYKRPLILIEQKNLENDNQVYKDSGLALIISSSDQLAEIVQGVAKSGFDFNEWNKRRKEFLNFHLANYNADAFLNFVKELRSF